MDQCASCQRRPNCGFPTKTMPLVLCTWKGAGSIMYITFGFSQCIGFCLSAEALLTIARSLCRRLSFTFPLFLHFAIAIMVCSFRFVPCAFFRYVISFVFPSRLLPVPPFFLPSCCHLLASIFLHAVAFHKRYKSCLLFVTVSRFSLPCSILLILASPSLLSCIFLPHPFYFTKFQPASFENCLSVLGDEDSLGVFIISPHSSGASPGQGLGEFVEFPR